MSLSAILRKPTAPPTTDDERSFAALAKRLGLNRAGMGIVRDLAAAADAPPIALLVSEHAFLIGLAESERQWMLEREPMPDARRRAIATARHQLFAEP